MLAKSIQKIARVFCFIGENILLKKVGVETIIPIRQLNHFFQHVINVVNENSLFLKYFTYAQRNGEL